MPKGVPESDIGVDGWRLCTKCRDVKREEDFYEYKPGKFKSRCKACHIKQVRQRTLERRQEAQNAH